MLPAEIANEMQASFTFPLVICHSCHYLDAQLWNGVGQSSSQLIEWTRKKGNAMGMCPSRISPPDGLTLVSIHRGHNASISAYLKIAT